MTTLSEESSGAAWEPPALASRRAAQVSAGDIEAVREAARQEGFSTGYAEGIAAGRARGEGMMAEMQALLTSLAAPLEEFDRAVIGELLALVERVSSAVLLRELYRSSNIEAVLQQALQVLGEGHAEITLQLHPDDAALCRDLGLVKGDRFRVVEDAQLQRGGATLSAGGSFIDATLESRLSAVIHQLREEAGAGELVDDRAGPATAGDDSSDG